MRIKIQNILYRLRQSFWFLPACMAGTAILLSVLTTALDKLFFHPDNTHLWWLYGGDPEGARTILSVISSSMITVAGVVFSITIVVLSLASSQFGPRLIRNFMNVRTNQAVLGTFVATFIYGILVLSRVDSGQGEVWVPRFSVVVAILMSLLSLALLIYFIHSVAESIQAQHIISRVRRDLDKTVDRLFSEEIGPSEDSAIDSVRRHDDYDVPTTCDHDACSVVAESSGYLQAVDIETLLKLAIEQNLLIHLGHRPGDFITKGCKLTTVWPGEKVDDALSKKVNALIIVGAERTLEQDVEFAVSQLVEIAVRALSPGINDPITAVTCIDWLGSSLCKLANRSMPASHRYDERNRLRIIVKSFTFDGIVNMAFNMIRQNAQSNVAVSIHILETMAVVAAQTRSKQRRATLMRQAAMVVHGCENMLPDDSDQKDLNDRYEAVSRLVD
jgi:uncharacterized membrane protein